MSLTREEIKIIDELCEEYRFINPGERGCKGYREYLERLVILSRNVPIREFRPELQKASPLVKSAYQEFKERIFFVANYP